MAKKYKEYEVKRFDSLLSIAKEQNVEFRKLASLNDLTQIDNYKIKVGQAIKLPILVEKEKPTEK